MAKLYQLSCPKCNNKTDFYRYGKDAHGHQKYQCKKLSLIHILDHHLHHAVMIPQIQEFNAAVVADILHPAGHPDLFGEYPRPRRR